jgi:hypothetical protein
MTLITSDKEDDARTKLFYEDALRIVQFKLKGFESATLKSFCRNNSFTYQTVINIKNGNFSLSNKKYPKMIGLLLNALDFSVKIQKVDIYVFDPFLSKDGNSLIRKELEILEEINKA